MPSAMVNNARRGRGRLGAKPNTQLRIVPEANSFAARVFPPLRCSKWRATLVSTPLLDRSTCTSRPQQFSFNWKNSYFIRK